jgi:cell division septal protein FtsQ
MIMALRRDRPVKRRKSSQQEFLGKPAKRRSRPARRQHRQEQALLPGLRADSSRPARRWPRLSALRAVAALLAVGLIAAVGMLFSSDLFYIQTAAMRGLHITSAEQVYRQAGIDGYSVFWIDERAVAQRIEALPYVRQATVRTTLPNLVQIEIEERQPLVTWKVNGQEFWVDREGATMPVLSTEAQAAAGLALTLPALWDLDGSTALADQRLDPQLVASLQQLHQQTPEVIDFGYDRIKGLQFRFPGGTYVSLGFPEGMAQRTSSLLMLHQSLASQGQTPAEIDWRDQEGYFLRLTP